MTNPSSSLLARAHAYTSHRAGRTALTIAPLAALGLAAENARAVAVQQPPVFSATPNVSYGPDNRGAFFSQGGSNTSVTGTALAQGSNGVTGVKFSGTSGFTDFEGNHAGLIGTITTFSLTGTASGNVPVADTTLPIAYNFTLATTTGGGNELINITGWTLTVSITTVGTGGGTTSAVVTNSTGGAGLFTGTSTVAVSGAANGVTLSSYAASLTVSYAVANNNVGGTLSVTIPVNSIDLNAVPEPSTWAIMATGVAGAGFSIMRVRERRAKSVPTVV